MSYVILQQGVTPLSRNHPGPPFAERSTPCTRPGIARARKAPQKTCRKKQKARRESPALRSRRMAGPGRRQSQGQSPYSWNWRRRVEGLAWQASRAVVAAQVFAKIVLFSYSNGLLKRRPRRTPDAGAALLRRMTRHLENPGEKQWRISRHTRAI